MDVNGAFRNEPSFSPRSKNAFLCIFEEEEHPATSGPFCAFSLSDSYYPRILLCSLSPMPLCGSCKSRIRKADAARACPPSFEMGEFYCCDHHISSLLLALIRGENSACPRERLRAQPRAKKCVALSIVSNMTICGMTHRASSCDRGLGVSSHVFR